MPHEDGFYTMEDAMRLLDCSEKLVRRMVKRGELPALPHGKSLKFRCEDLDAFLERIRRTGSGVLDRRL
ncbi:MAG: helix-turn-helix domain-containing protein [Candidatus Hydrogenedentota bacterium]